MGHAAIDDRTPFASATTFPSDEEGRPLLVVLVQATYTIAAAGPLTLADEQVPPNLAGERWSSDPATSSYRIEPAFAFAKLATDVVLLGHAVSRRGPVAELFVNFRVGALGKSVRVLGDRAFARAGGQIAITRPIPFERMPLAYERAFGGWDRSSSDPRAHAVLRENPVGRGFVAPDAPFRDGVALPNLEDPTTPIERYGQRVPPAGFGFVSPDWMPRAALGGTYDDAWRRDRMPRLPFDFDCRFFNAGARDLVAAGPVRGGEPVVVEGASPFGRLSFDLPTIPRPRARVSRVNAADAEVELTLDTIVVDTDESRVLLLSRAAVPLRDGPHDVRSIEITSVAAPTRTAGERRAWA